MKATFAVIASAVSLVAQASVIPNTTRSTSCLRARDDPSSYGTEVEIGDNTVTTVWVYTVPSGQTIENHPYGEAFTELFDNIYDMCGETQCGLDKSEPMEYCTWPLNPELAETGGGPQICLQATGSFGSASKDEIFHLGRAAFDGSVVREYFTQEDGVLLDEVHETGASFIHIVTGPAFTGGSGYDLSFNLFLEYNNEGCGPIVERIAQAGSVVGGDVAPVFGLVGLVCAAV